MLLKDEVRLKNSKMQLKAAQRNAKSNEYLQQSIRSAKESERTTLKGDLICVKYRKYREKYQ